jgi:hypothetical protein
MNHRNCSSFLYTLRGEGAGKINNYMNRKREGTMKLRKLLGVCLAMTLCVGLLGFMASCAFFESDDDNPTTPNGSVTPIPSGPGTRPTNLLLDDPLTNGTSKATLIGGGEFTPEGYHLTSHFGYIIYDTQITGNFRVEFDTKGLTSGEPYHDPDDQSTILFMQDAPLGTDWTQWAIIPHCLFQMIKLDWYPGGGSTDAMKVKGACNGGGGYELWSYLPGGIGGRWVGPQPDWDPDQNYHWVVTVKDGHVETFRDGVQLFYGDGFWPGDPIRFFFGGTGTWVGQVSPDNATYSNIKVYQE